MYKLWQATYKEILLLKRDLGGLAILFIMPLVLVVTVTLIQDSSFKQINDNKIPILFVDNDNGEVSKSIVTNLKKSSAFEIVSQINGENINETQANQLVLKGKYQLAIIIPKNLTVNLNTKVENNVSKILANFMEDAEEKETIQEPIKKEISKIKTQEIKLYFDPATQLAFKNGVKDAIDKMVAKIESQSIYQVFQKELEIEGNVFEQTSFIKFSEINPRKKHTEIKPNSVQHNVPAWSLFAIFFIIIPLSINIVKEKNQGTFVRLKTNPVSYATILGSKIITYLSVCMIQFLLMLLIGFYLFPYLNLPALEINGSYYLLFIVALFVGLAAIGLGVLLGTFASTPEQSAPFGATLVVILAAIGGVWIPVFIMPKMMQIIAKISPMNWGLNGFYDVILRDAKFIDIVPEISLLALFFVVMLSISIYYNKLKSAV